MGELTIDRFQCRYRLPASRVHERARIDAVLAELTAGALEDVVDRARLDPAAVLCIRRLEVPVALRLGGPDRGMLEAWAAAFRAALDRAIATGELDGPHGDELLVRFESRRHALVELGVAVARDEVSQRAWAWQQLGMWPAYDPGDRVARARAFATTVVREGGGAVGLLVALAERGALPQLAADVPADAWIALAASAGMPRAGASRSGGAPDPDRIARASRLVASSPLAPSLVRVARTAEPEAAAALASLILLAAEPALALQGPAPLQGAIDAAALELHAPVGEDAAPAERTSDLVDPSSSEPEPIVDPADRTEDDRAVGGDPATAANDPAPTDDAGSERTVWHTANAGLLFTLGVIDELSLPARLVADAAFGDRPFTEVLRALAVEIAPVPADDPAIAAFCGLHRLEALDDLALPEDFSGAERAVLVAAAAEVHTELRDRLGHDAAAAQELATLHARNADIFPEPGWTEVRLAHDQASTAIRRARLDLDPGWLRWLGAVVRFVYA